MTWREWRPHRYAGPARAVLLGGAAVVAAAYVCEVRLDTLVTGFDKGISVSRLFLPPDWTALPDMVPAALATLAVALIATPMGAAAACVVGLAAAHNVAPVWLRQPTRLLLAIERGLPEIVTLIVLVAAFGVGPLAGVVALTLGSVGMLGKLVADAIEEIDVRTVDSVTCVGATTGQMIRFAILPTVVPALVTHALFRLEVNIRASVLLGAIGAGGIGYELNVAMGQLQYRRGAVAALVSLVLVVVVERGADWCRGRLGGGVPA